SGLAMGAWHGAVTLSGALSLGTSTPRPVPANTPLEATTQRGTPSGYRPGLFPLRSLLLGESPLVALPPPSDMLKSVGWAHPSRGCSAEAGGGRARAPPALSSPPLFRPSRTAGGSPVASLPFRAPLRHSSDHPLRPLPGCSPPLPRDPDAGGTSPSLKGPR